MENKNRTLYYLSELSDYKVASDDPDVRGWKVNDREQRCIGKVDNLLVNKNTKRVVYLDIEVDQSIIDSDHQVYTGVQSRDGVHEFLNEKGENHLILPIGLVTLDKDTKKVHTQSVDFQTFASAKRYAKGNDFNREYELAVLSNYDRNEDRGAWLEGDNLYDDDVFIKKY